MLKPGHGWSQHKVHYLKGLGLGPDWKLSRIISRQENMVQIQWLRFFNGDGVKCFKWVGEQWVKMFEFAGNRGQWIKILKVFLAVNLAQHCRVFLSSAISSQILTAMAQQQLCADPSEAVEFFGPKELFLKPIAKINISVTLPQLKTTSKAISNWEVMEKLRRMVKPDIFLMLRVSKSSMEFIRFEAEIETRGLIKVFLTRLDGKSMKLQGFPELLKVRAAEAKLNFPNRHDWDSFFRDAKNMNESNPGERPDTIHMENLPCKWFALDSEPDKPSELILQTAFASFIGEVRRVDIPMLDPYRHEDQIAGGNFKTFTFSNSLTFDAYVQFMEYIGFVKAMDALKGMKLMKKTKDGKAYTAEIKVIDKIILCFSFGSDGSIKLSDCKTTLPCHLSIFLSPICSPQSSEKHNVCPLSPLCRLTTVSYNIRHEGNHGLVRTTDALKCINFVTALPTIASVGHSPWLFTCHILSTIHPQLNTEFFLSDKNVSCKLPL